MSLSFADAAKAKQLREYFAEHGRIYIVVDATSDDVDLPDSLKGDPALRLVLNSRMPQMIHIRDDALESNFSFSGVSYPCKIPMHKIWAAYLPEGDLDQGLIWEESVPEMIRAIVQAVSSHMPDDAELQEESISAQVPVETPAEEKPAPASIKIIKGGGSDKAEATEDKQPKERKTGHLRVVK